MSNSDRLGLLDFYYQTVKQQLLKYQSGALGLFAHHTSGTNSDAYVRENVYCAMAVWGLALAYRHIDDDQGKTHDLELSAVKCMRGILFCYMRQSDKVESFKRTQHFESSLHCKFDVVTGNPSAGDKEYEHLQIGIVSVYLLTLVRMITSGLHIIYTTDEVNFIQNLVYYVERTYRTADYGMWERGGKYNDGKRELSASSVGMAKAALEAVNGFNVFGSQGTSWSVIYSDPDAHNRNKSILQTLLPKESNSKGTDGALLTITGFPAFAIDDISLRMETKENILETLMGNYGLKRFVRDGYGTVLENKNKKYYDRSELKQFDGVECEWPIFYVYLAIEAMYDGNNEDAGKYMETVEALLEETSEGMIIPKYYYVPLDSIEDERRAPGSCRRFPNDDPDVFLWGQALFILAKLLAEGLVTPAELDPLARYAYKKAHSALNVINYRYSSFQAQGSDLMIQVCLISENRYLQAALATYGIITQTPKELQPILICRPGCLVKVYGKLGVNKKLGLSGRPNRPLGALGTSKIYRIMGKTVATYPIILEERDFYMSYDMSLMIDEIKASLAFIRSRWSMRGRPTVCLLLREHNFRGPHFTEMLDFMNHLKNGEVNGVKVRMGRLQTFISTACIEHLDFLNSSEDFPLQGIEEDNILLSRTSSGSMGFKSFYQPDSLLNQNDPDEHESIQHFEHHSTEDVVERLRKSTSLTKQTMFLHVLYNRKGLEFQFSNITVLDGISEVYKKASYVRHWSVVRYGASLLGKLVDSLAPSITTMLVSGRQVTLGAFGHEEHVISEPITPAAIEHIIFSLCMPYDPKEAVLQQEILIHLAGLVATKPHYFKGMLRIRVGWIIEAMKNQLLLITDKNAAEDSKDAKEKTTTSVYALSPSAIKHLLYIVLEGKGQLDGCNLTPKNWRQKRQLEGALNRVPLNFYSKVWSILERVPGGLKVANRYLPQLPTLSEMTVEEMNFSLRVEELLAEIRDPEYRQVVIELLTVVATILERNPELEIQQCIDLDELVEEAIALFASEPSRRDQVTDRQLFFELGPAEKRGTMSYFARAVVNQLLQGAVALTPDHTCMIS